MNLIAKSHFGSRFDASCAMQRFCATALLVSVTMLAAIDADAQTIKKWVDEEGVTHYSDQLPVGEEADVREVDIPEAPVSEYDSGEVNERLKKQLQELEEAREAREREAEAADRTRELDQALEREPVVEQEKKKKKDRDRPYSGPYPKPLPGPFPEQYPRQRGPATPENPIERSN
jgi:hypothetical protein